MRANYRLNSLNGPDCPHLSQSFMNCLLLAVEIVRAEAEILASVIDVVFGQPWKSQNNFLSNIPGPRDIPGDAQGLGAAKQGPLQARDDISDRKGCPRNPC
jgi:hypothetical protein